MITVIGCFVAARGPPVQRKPLKHRDYEVDLESRLGKTQVLCLVLIYFLEFCICLNLGYAIWLIGYSVCEQLNIIVC